MRHLSTTLFLTLVTLAVLPPSSHAQHLPSALSEYFAEVRSGNYLAAPTNLLITTPYETTFSWLQPYLQDSMTTVRAKAFEILHATAHTREGDKRRQAVETLVRACSKEATEVSGKILGYLKGYSREDFTAPAKDTIRSLVRKAPAYFGRILRLAGFLNLQDLKTEIRRWTQPGNPTPLRWSAYLSLARMGDVSATTEIHHRVKRLPVNDDVVYQIFPDLIYTRQHTLFAYMVEALHDKENNCLSSDPEREIPIPCGYRIMEQLARAIEGFPFVLQDSGDLNASDYPKALEKVRAWFEANKTYTILNDKY